MTHKRRSAWYRQSTAWPFREPTALELEKGRDPARLPPAASRQPSWTSLGPTNVGGRMTSAVAQPGAPVRILAGSAGGGVWRSDDSGLNWRDSSSGLAVLHVGSLAGDPQQADVVYCGTGEANLSADSHPGDGLYRSSDWGGSWTRIAAPVADGVPGRIGAVAVDPRESKHILIGGVGHRSDGSDPTGGLFRTTDGGGSWQRVDALSAAPFWCHDVQFLPEGGVVLATITERGSKNGIWRSTDNGATWSQLNIGLPPPEHMWRASLAVAPSDSRFIYALVADAWDGVLGVYRSWDSGVSWGEIGHGQLAKERQMNYNNTIVVHPDDREVVCCGGVDLHLWRNGRWRQVTAWDSRVPDREYAHADHHALLMPDGDLVYDMNDGGVAVSTDAGTHWDERSTNLTTTLFYDLAVAPSDSQALHYGGGTQDNGTLATTAGANRFRPVTGGDGGWMAYDPGDAARFYSSDLNVRVYLHKAPGWREDISPPEEQAVHDSAFISILTLRPRRSQTVYVATTRVWRSKPAPEQETSWVDIPPSLDGSTITALEVAPANPDFLYAGTENGAVFVSRDRGDNWSGDLSSRVLPGAAVTRIRTHPGNAERVLLVVGLIGHSHAYRSTDGGATWEDIDKGQLPPMPLRALVIDPAAPDVVYAGGDVGIFVSRDFGTTWETFTGSLGRAIVTDLVIHEGGTRTLNAATYGQGLWRTALPTWRS